MKHKKLVKRLRKHLAETEAALHQTWRDQDDRALAEVRERMLYQWHLPPAVLPIHKEHALLQVLVVSGPGEDPVVCYHRWHKGKSSFGNYHKGKWRKERGVEFWRFIDLSDVPYPIMVVKYDKE